MYMYRYLLVFILRLSNGAIFPKPIKAESPDYRNAAIEFKKSQYFTAELLRCIKHPYKTPQIGLDSHKMASTD